MTLNATLSFAKLNHPIFRVLRSTLFLLVLFFGLCACGTKSRTQVWEYMSLSMNTSEFTMHTDSGINIGAFNMTKYGKKGWELISTIPITESDYRYSSGALNNVETKKVVLIFKRPLSKKRK